MRLRFAFQLMLLSLLLVACGSIGEDYVLDSNAVAEGDQFVAAVNADLQAGSRVNGDMSITASTVMLNGQVTGDLTIVAADLRIGETAQLQGDLIYCLVGNQHFEQAEKAVVWGRIRSSCDEKSARLDFDNANDHLLVRLLGNVVIALGAGLLAALAIIFLPHHMEQISQAARQASLAAGGLGCLSLLTMVGLLNLWRFSLVLVVPVVLAPFIALLGAAVIGLVILGAVSIGQPFGEWLLRRARISEQLPLVTATLGTSTLTFLVLFFRLVPALAFITSILAALVAAWALGAALITRAGTCACYRR